MDSNARIILHTKLTLFEAIDHLHRYVENIHSDMDAVALGSFIRYPRKKLKLPRKRKTHVNDGRPPDTTRQLLPTKVLSSTTPYQMVYAANLQASETHMHMPESPLVSFGVYEEPKL